MLLILLYSCIWNTTVLYPPPHYELLYQLLLCCIDREEAENDV